MRSKRCKAGPTNSMKPSTRRRSSRGRRCRRASSTIASARGRTGQRPASTCTARERWPARPAAAPVIIHDSTPTGSSRCSDASVECILDRGRVVEVGGSRVQAELDRQHRDVRASGRSPAFRGLRHLGVALRARVAISSKPKPSADRLPPPCDDGRGHAFHGGVDVAGEREAVAEPAAPPVRRLGEAPDPDRDQPPRSRVDAGSLEAIEATLERDQRLRPQVAQQLDLLVQSRAPSGEVLAQGVVLDVVPPGADSEPDPLAREQVGVGGLLGDERVWRWGRIITPVASSIREVTAAR